MGQERLASSQAQTHKFETWNRKPETRNSEPYFLNRENSKFETRTPKLLTPNDSTGPPPSFPALVLRKGDSVLEKTPDFAAKTNGDPPWTLNSTPQTPNPELQTPKPLPLNL